MEKNLGNLKSSFQLQNPTEGQPHAQAFQLIVGLANKKINEFIIQLCNQNRRGRVVNYYLYTSGSTGTYKLSDQP